MSKELRQCYLATHPDAHHFAPGSKDSPHLAIWNTFVVDRVYRVGGYGDEAQIGWVDMDRWHRAGRASEEEWLAEWQATSHAIASKHPLPQSERAALDPERIATLFGDNPADERAATGSDRLVFQ